MIATSLALVALALSALHTPPAYALRPQSVRVVHYSPGVFQRVLQIRARQGYRVRWDVDGYASRPSCGTIGQVFWLSVNGGRARRYQQMDCSRPGADYRRHVAANQVEIDWQSARVTGLYRDGHGRGLLWGQ